jgi:hypothetical protein
MLSDFRVSRIEGEDNESSENSTSVIAMAGNDKAKFVSAWGQKPALKKSGDPGVTEHATCGLRNRRRPNNVNDLSSSFGIHGLPIRHVHAAVVEHLAGFEIALGDGAGFDHGTAERPCGRIAEQNSARNRVRRFEMHQTRDMPRERTLKPVALATMLCSKLILEPLAKPVTIAAFCPQRSAKPCWVVGLR